jgi:hypothetical protein
LGETWEDGDSPDTATSESVYLPKEGGDGKAEMTGKAWDGLRLALSIYNEKRSDEMGGRDFRFREKSADFGGPAETSGTDRNGERYLLHRGEILTEKPLVGEVQRGRAVRASFQRTIAKTKQIRAAIQRPFFSRKSEHFSLMSGPASGRKIAKRKGTMAGKSDRKLNRAKAETLAKSPLARVIWCPTVMARIEVFG